MRVPRVFVLAAVLAAVSVPALGSDSLTRLDRALAALDAPAWQDRAAGVAALLPILEANQPLYAEPRIQTAVAALLARERRAIADAVRNATPMPDNRSAHCDALMVVALHMLEDSTAETRPRLLSALVQGFYMPGSRFTMDLASHGEAIVADVLRLAGDQAVGHRRNAYALMGALLSQHARSQLRHPLSHPSVMRLVRTLRAGLQDPEARLRIQAIAAIVSAGDGDAVPLLQTMAKADPHSSVRKSAGDAMWALTSP